MQGTFWYLSEFLFFAIRNPKDKGRNEVRAYVLEIAKCIEGFIKSLALNIFQV